MTAELRALVRLAIPVVLAQTGLMMMGVVDTMVVGHLSADALAAVALGNLFSWATLIFGMGMLQCLDALVAQAHGAGFERTARLIAVRGLFLAGALTIVTGALSFFAEPLLIWSGQAPPLAREAQRYLNAILPGLPAHYAFVVFRQAAQARGRTGPVVAAVVVGNIVNLLLDLGLVFGRFGMPAMGTVGSGWATTIGRYLMLATLVSLSWRHALPRAATRRELFSPRAWMQMLKIGVPIGVQFALEVWVFSISSLLIGRFGAVTLGGHQIALNLASLSFMVPLGVGAAAATRVGNAVGRGDQAGAKRAAHAALLLGAIVMFASAFLFWTEPRALASLYTSDPALLAMAATLLPLAAIFQIFDGVQAVSFGALRGAADTRVPTVIYVVGFWVVGLPTGYYSAFRLALGAPGIWYGFIGGLGAVAILAASRLLWRFRARAELRRVVDE